MKFHENDIFEGMYPPEVADWCCENQEYTIAEIESEDEVRRFQIVKIEPTVIEDEGDNEIAIMKNTIAEQDQAICELYELLIGGDA